MVIITAQEESVYFAWQLKVQLKNLQDKGFDLSKYYALFLRKTFAIPIMQEILELKILFPEINLFFLTDKREKKFNYLPSLRPYLIANFLRENPHIKKFLYIDSDCIFTKAINLEKYFEDDTWYMSDANKYLSYSFLQKADKMMAQQMAHIIGISEDVLIDADDNVGGAQYIIKNTDSEFWLEVMNKSEDLFNEIKGRHENTVRSWCADMWALLWVSLLKGNRHKVVEDMSFCWSYDKISKWEDCTFYHHAGDFIIGTDEIFHKKNYRSREPNYLILEKYSNIFCSYNYVKEIIKTYQQ